MITEFIQQHNLPKYRIDQFNDQYYTQAIESFDELTNWSKDLRDKLNQEIEFTDLEEDRVFESKKGDTIKVLFKRKIDSQRIETVLMKHEDGRNTVCVSCMVGCPVNCSFCATGKMGFGGNLSAKEIVDQVMYFQRKLKTQDQKVTNVVFMGMGEPMLNLAEVMKAMDVFTAEDKLGMSMRRFTISTSGYVKQLKQLIEKGYRGRIAISLHAPNQQLREKMMPVAKIYSLDELMKELDEYVGMTNKRVSYEYILIKNVNDTAEHMAELSDLLKDRLAHVNLIPFNPIKEEDFERSEESTTSKFAKYLNSQGIPTTIRITMGEDVDAACGQLADRENKKNRGKRLKV